MAILHLIKLLGFIALESGFVSLKIITSITWFDGVSQNLC